MESTDDNFGIDFSDPYFKAYVDGPGSKLPLENSESKKTEINVFVSRLPKNLQKEGLLRLFRRHKIEAFDCKLLYNKDGTSTQSALVQVKSNWAATKAIQCLNDKPPLNLGVTLAEEKDDYDKKQECLKEFETESFKRDMGIKNTTQ